MTGGTLVVTRNTSNHQYFKKYLEDKGFRNVFITDVEKDGLNIIIKEKKPNLVMIEACFYECCTPYMMGELLKEFPKLNIAAVNLYNYPDELAIWFIYHGVNSYLNMYEGVEEFRKSLMSIRNGNSYISLKIKERMALRKEASRTDENITPRHKEVLKLICCGFDNLEIGDILHISRRTAYTHRTKIYRILNATSPNELMRAALYLKLVDPTELYFYRKNFVTNPKPRKTKSGGKNANKNKIRTG